MAKKFGGEPNERMSNIMSGTRHRGAGEIRAGSTVRSESYANSPVLGTSGPFKKQTLTAAPGKTSLQKTKNVPRTYAAPRMSDRVFSIYARGPIKKPVVVAKPVAKPVVKPPVKKPPAVVSNVVREKLSPVQNSSVSRKPPATRFGTVTGKTTGTRVSGGGGYGGGGTRGGGSLSGQGSGTRSAGTSRTGGTRSNNPVRG